jgi:hypothetical protein
MTVSKTAFGLDLESELPLAFLGGASAAPTGRPLEIELGSGLRSSWPVSAELVCDERAPDGATIFQIESDAGARYLISGPEYGSHLLSGDGCRLWCDPEGLPDERWQRLLIAQILPFAALLQGLEVFHASAVVRHGEAVAFVGRSGAGKSSLALELCGHAAKLLADDVLALEICEQRLLAHPGTPLASVARESVDEDVHLPRGEVVAVNPRERLVRVEGASEPAPLVALFFLERLSDGPERPRLEAVADAQMLLSATFNFVLATPERLRGLLEVCALAATLHVARVVYGPSTSVAQLGEAVEQRLSATL